MKHNQDDQGSEADKLLREASVSCKVFSDIEPKEIDWLWHERIAIGKVTVIAGDPGLGKSMATAALAATVSTGGLWPVVRTECRRGDVLIMSAEDDPDDTIRPRLDAAGADVSRVHCVGLVSDYRDNDTPYLRGFDIDTDLNLLSGLLEKLPETRLVVIDPVSAFLGRTDSHNNAQMRGLLAPLGALAAKHGVAIVCVTHLNKGGSTSSMHRITGSLALVAAARASYLITKDQDDPKRRLMLPMKNNLGDDNNGFAYEIDIADNGAPFVLWEKDLVEVSADDALNNISESNEDAGALNEAKEWILAQLEKGAVPSEEILGRARKDGISTTTLKRAKADIGINSKRDGSHWAWVAPDGTYNAKSVNDCAHIHDTLDLLPETRINTGLSDSNIAQECQESHESNAGSTDPLAPERHAQQWRSRINKDDEDADIPW